MRENDKLAMFLIQAIAIPNQEFDARFYFDKYRKRLIRADVDKRSDLLINPELVELPKLKFEEKSQFLKEYKIKLPVKIQDLFQLIIDEFNESSEFKPDRALQKVDPNWSMQLAVDSMYFLNLKVKEYYSEFHFDLSWELDFFGDTLLEYD